MAINQVHVDTDCLSFTMMSGPRRCKGVSIDGLTEQWLAQSGLIAVATH